ncbi:alpha/beta fold hydrolase [Streptomyces sp. NPDC059092]|uniref:alpha/beta fold hydrolase n=1 Tax=Streptomyces sp. NPDC059092 TaxID=3346725 RepID=UPI0036793DDD
MDETVRTDDGVRLWATRAARAPGGPVILCHGGPGLWDTLEAPAALLADPRDGRDSGDNRVGRAGRGSRDGWGTRGGPVVRWDQRGCGRSQRSGPYGAARSVADLDAVRRHFGLERTALLGHSWGAHLALSYALAHPDRVSALIYVSGTGIDEDDTWLPYYQDAFRRKLGTHRRRWEELRDRGEDRTPEEDRELAVLQWSADFEAAPDRAREYAEAMATPWFGVNRPCNTALVVEMRQSLATGAPRERCAALEVPVLIVDGELDIRPRWAVDSLERALPRVVRTTLAGAGHLPWTEDPEGFRAALAAFLG